jgi:hypothetical protein
LFRGAARFFAPSSRRIAQRKLWSIRRKQGNLADADDAASGDKPTAQ